MVFCSVVGCCNRSDSSRRKKPTNTNFFRIPRIVVDRCERSKTLSTNRHTLWLVCNNRADLDPQNPNLRVCGAHFMTVDQQESATSRLPSLLMQFVGRRIHQLSEGPGRASTHEGTSSRHGSRQPAAEPVCESSPSVSARAVHQAMQHQPNCECTVVVNLNAL
ncbi:hypothetical protein HPB49_007511 [Dermacentor silvarum]|uniref:Uncharacterized protein n=1 Tax=Dermacentor silvarum TaxID=543639 RepID=A0ACB8DB75_DERSI|nr:hypothetical protein HPB49_007511 [Dermacentor silvarum]